jgi:hypothetical protein
MMTIQDQIRGHLKERGWQDSEVTPAVMRYFELVWRQNWDLEDYYEKAREGVAWAENLRSI